MALGAQAKLTEVIKAGGFSQVLEPRKRRLT
jgi:hypothetical protein